ncbi:hypothetical protein EV359DRAFT_69058 [Lentinula novae-zelandiae]|nr:hypothetical protein EV359DRAFT_69058 [Lentinula novae-zelandiae]
MQMKAPVRIVMSIAACKIMESCTEPWLELELGHSAGQKAAGNNNNTTEMIHQESKQNEITCANQAKQDKRDNNSNRGFMPGIPRLNDLPFVAFTAFALDTLQLPKILFNAGALSYLLFSIKLLWKVSTMFQSQPHVIAIYMEHSPVSWSA